MLTSVETINSVFGTAAGDDLTVAMDIACEEADDTGVRQRVELCRCLTGRHFSFRPVKATLEVAAGELVVVSR